MQVAPGPYLEKYFGGVDINIHYQYSKIFKVNFYNLLLMLSGINNTMLVNIFFFVTATAVQWRTKDLAEWLKTGGLGGGPQPPTNFYGFHIKNTLLNTAFYRKRRYRAFS